MTNQTEVSLITARLMLHRKDYHAAQRVLAELLHRYPDCQAAQELLHEVEVAMMESNPIEMDVDCNVNIFAIESGWQQLAAAICGVTAIVFGLFIGVDFLIDYLREGKNGELLLYSKFTSRPISYPVHFLMVPPLALVSIGIWLVLTAYRSWRER